MGSRLSFSIDAEPALRELEFPPLTLISLVENAIKHGIEPKSGNGHIAVRAAKIATDRGQMLELSVDDDGAGLKSGVTTGLGLANIRAQLAARFGEDARVDIRKAAKGGVSAKIGIPL